uniref:Uncharacterized protein n=1 Tax=Ditylenchus dipsaci TaxID=166011 RepID=A0A915DKX5_9BILA
MSPSRVQVFGSDHYSNKIKEESSYGNFRYPCSLVSKNVSTIPSSHVVDSVLLPVNKCGPSLPEVKLSTCVPEFSLPPPDLTKLSPDMLKVYEMVVPCLHSAVKNKKATKQVLDSVMGVFFPPSVAPLLKVHPKVSRSLQDSAKSDASAVPVNPMKLENWRSKPKTPADEENNRLQNSEMDDELTAKILDMSMANRSDRNPVLKPAKYFCLNMEGGYQFGGPLIGIYDSSICRLCFGTDHSAQTCPLYDFTTFSMYI